MITYFDKKQLDSILERFSRTTNLQLKVVERDSGKLFPYIRAGVLYYNKHFETFLLLTALTPQFKKKLFGLQPLFYDTYNSIDLNYYEIADALLELLENTFKIAITESALTNFDVHIDIIFLLSICHELGHYHFSQDKNTKNNYITFTHNFIKDSIENDRKKKIKNFYTRIAMKTKNKWLKDNAMLEEIACDIYSLSFIYEFLIEKNYQNQSIEQIIMECPYVIYSLEYINRIVTTDEPIKKRLNNIKRNASLLSECHTRVFLFVEYCLEFTTIPDDFGKHYLWFSVDTFKYHIKNINNSNSVSSHLSLKGAKAEIDTFQKHFLLSRLSLFEDLIKVVLKNKLDFKETQKPV